MSEITLKLKHVTSPVREAAAWFIPGADVALWLEEICRWQIPQANLRLFVLPPSSADRSPAGVLAVPPLGIKPACIPRALPFGVLAGKLYLPIDAELWPPVSSEELVRTRSTASPNSLPQVTDSVERVPTPNPDALRTESVFHPGIGLVGFEPADTLSVADLLRQPPSRVENWNFAKPGVELSERLLSIELIAPISMQQLFGDAPSEIGTDPIQQLPPAPDEPSSNPAARLWDAANRRFAEALHSLLKKLPHTGTSRTWINDLEDWAAKKFQGLARDLETMRNKEIHRLLHELEHNPDQGLRHALPMSGFGHRGLAPPSDRLGTRTPDFSLDHLRGGRPGDIWNLAGDVQAKLIAKYRELANRELQLGRYRRAAYIYAQLLGDLHAAASALKQGRHFREAAAMYKDYLRHPVIAAECLAEGGLFAEAVAIYEKESLFVEAGDLYVRIGQPDKAKAAYDSAVQKQLSAGDRLTAAQLAEQKLENPEQALTILAEGWPDSPQAGKCLDAQMELLARKNWHPHTATVLDKLRSEPTRRDLIVTLAKVLASQSAKYPDRALRHTMADLVRVKASERLDTAPSGEVMALADALTQLAPDDKLLARDTIRFRSLRVEMPPPLSKAVPIRKTAGPILIRTFKLPLGITWRNVKSCGAYFFAVGHSNHKLWLLRGDWEGSLQSLHWQTEASLMPLSLFELDEEISRPAHVLVTGTWRPEYEYREQAFPAADRFPGVVPAGTPDWFPQDVVAACARGNTLFLWRSAETVLLETRTLDGQLISNSVLDQSLLFHGSGTRNLVAQRDFIWAATDKRLTLYRKGSLVGSWEAETAIGGLTPSAPNLPLCMAVRLEKGVSLHWTDNLKERTETICEELAGPLTAFTNNGTLVLVSANEGRICDVGPNGVRAIGHFTFLGLDPFALVRAEGPNQFALFSKDGKVQLFRAAT